MVNVNTVDRATELFYENQKLAFFTLARYYPYYKNNEDMQQEAFIGLWKACLGFNPEFGYKFSSYAVACIHGYLRNIFSKNPEIKNNIEMLSLDFAYTNPDGGRFTLEDSVQDGKLDIDINSLYCYDLISKLKPEEANVIRQRLIGYTFKEIGNKNGYSSQRAQQVFARAIKKLQIIVRGDKYEEMLLPS